MFQVLDISTSGLVAQRTRMNAISDNIANIDTLVNENREYDPYRRRVPIFSVGDPSSGSSMGVHVSEIEVVESGLPARYEPESPFADDQGYVYHPNVSLEIEQVNALEAARAYEANITAIEVTKSMMSIALQIIA